MYLFAATFDVADIDGIYMAHQRGTADNNTSSGTRTQPSRPPL
ncbi:MAG: hypothetical protein ACOYJL_08220 [Tractidigestivibacter sp.]